VTRRTAFDIRPMTDRAALDELLRLRWSDGSIFVRGRLITPPDVEAFGAYHGNKLQGVATWRIEDGSLYLLTMNNITDRRGVGEALLARMLDLARERKLPHLRVIISNDNVGAFRFYQKRGFRIVAVHVGVVDMMRKMKPSIPEIGSEGIRMRDEIELEIAL
jgi:GNAT superfamily N-acetyltransferase